MGVLVSVRVLTYNHERYIKRCLEGILMQNVEFQYEIVIGEDCSVDGTSEIVSSYAKKHPDIIKLLTHEKNVGVIENSRRVKAACTGKYHASCEGDDYWIDPLKLQKQVEYMENHPDCSLLVHNAMLLSESNFMLPEIMVSFNRSEITTADLLNETPWPLPTSGRIMRASCLENLPEWYYDDTFLGGDYMTCLFSSLKGKIAFINDITSIYHRHEASLTFSGKKLLDKKMLSKYFNEYTHGKYEKELKKFISLDTLPNRVLNQVRKLNFYLHHPNVFYNRLVLKIFRLKKKIKRLKNIDR